MVNDVGKKKSKYDDDEEFAKKLGEKLGELGVALIEAAWAALKKWWLNRGKKGRS
ncbi:MAG: hypothetical protein V2A78_03285 [bacterium]